MSEELSPEQEAQREYREELRNVLIDVTNEFLREHQDELVKRAEARIKFMRELQGQ